MSQQIVHFLKKAETDKAILAKLRDAQRPEDVVRIGADAGYSFTSEELAHRELTEADLESVAGGGVIDDARQKYEELKDWAQDKLDRLNDALSGNR